MAASDRLQNDTSDSKEGPSILTGFTSAQSSLEGKPSPLTSLLTKTQTLTPSSLLPLLLTAPLLSGRGEAPIISRPANYRPNIVQVLKELAPEVDCNLVLQYLSEVDTDYLVECGLEIARRYRQLEEENESYRQRKEVFASLYEEERGKENKSYNRRYIALNPAMAERISKDSESDQERPSPLTSLLTALRTRTQTLTPSSLLPLLLTSLLLSGRGEVPIISGPANYIVRVLKELAPEVNCDLVLQYLSEVDTDYLVECGLEIARRYRQIEEENESYKQCKDVFASLYEKENGKVKELKTKLAETSRAMEKMKKENANVLEQVRQDYLKERRQLEAECERLKCILKHEEEEWIKEKQLLLEQIRNVRNEQRIEEERRELAGMNDHTSKIELSSNVLDFPQQSGPHNPPRVGNTDVGTGTHFTVSPALPTMAGMEEGHRLPTMAGMEGGHRPPTCALLVTDTTSLLLPWRPMQTTWQPYAHLSKNYNRIHTQTSNTHEMSEYTEDGEDLPSPVEETMYYERGRGVVQYSVEETGQHRTLEMVSGKLPF